MCKGKYYESWITGCALHDHLPGGCLNEQSCDDYSNVPMSAIIRSDKKSYRDSDRLFQTSSKLWTGNLPFLLKMT